MSTKTNIEWTDATWNPIRGCSRVSEGCRNCYAEKVAYRFSGPGQPYEGLAHKVNGHAAWTGAVGLVQKHLLDPLKWGPVITGCLTGREIPHAKKGHCPNCTERPRRIFVNSMSDLFHENVPDEWIDRIFAVMALCPQHTFQILTKRPERMREYISGPSKHESPTRFLCPRWPHILNTADFLTRAGGSWEKHRGAVKLLEARLQRGEASWPLQNVWLGVSVENQKTADERIPLLLETPAAVRFISAEPLLGNVMLPRNVFLPRLIHGDWPIGHNLFIKGERLAFSNPQGALSVRAQAGKMLGIKPGEFEDRGIGLDWVICGGESGSGARPMHPDWARSLRDQCRAAGVSFFFKQWGEWMPVFHGINPSDNDPKCRIHAGHTFAKTRESDGQHMWRVGKKAAGAMLDGREWREFPSSAVRA